MLGLKVIKRTGEVVEFDGTRIRGAILKAVEATGLPLADAALERICDAIRDEIEGRFVEFFPNVENIQDIVEKHLVREGQYEIAKSYILYRAERQKVRVEAKQRAVESARLGKLTVTKRDGRKALFNVKRIDDTIKRTSRGLRGHIASDLLIREVINNVYDGITTEGLERALVLASTAFIENDPAYSYLAARLLLQKIRKEVVGRSLGDAALDKAYQTAFKDAIKRGVSEGLLHETMGRFDLEGLAQGLEPERDELFQYLGVQTLYERYFLRSQQTCLELPQTFFMRVAMGLSINEPDRNERALEFYELMSQLRYIPSTPTMFHAGTSHPQLSSCYLTTVEDDLGHIFKCFSDNAMLSKWSGGIGNDWSNIRATGSFIASTQVDSQGVIPFLKIANDVTNAINRSGKRRGATCAYLETWHYDVEEFLDLRKNTGDERRRTHDMNTANWIPDLFMKRVAGDEPWTLFSPDEVPDLHHTFGSEFERRYTAYEGKAARGEMRLHKQISARHLWRKMLTMLYETGHPWITFKDSCNVRSPQDHEGVIHSSNLCTEITLNTSAEETAVCNLGSINLARHVVDGELDREALGETVRTAVRMLDNVVDINFYPTAEAGHSNLRHRPVGLGLMGFQDALYELGVPFESEEALSFADRTMEWVSYNAILSSSELAAERGPYDSYEGSKWQRGLFPLDTLDLLEKERGVPVETSRAQSLDWMPVRDHVRRHGMRNSNLMAIAPTATISNICGCFPCIEPIYKNIYVKANISGEFTVVNRYLVEDLRRLDLWNDEMLDQLKYYDGSVQQIAAIPTELKERYKEAFEIDPVWALRLTAARGKWIDQSQSHNVFMRGVSGKQLSDIYLTAWKLGLKTTYYLRTLAATQIEKSTLDANRYGFTQKREYGAPEKGVPVAATPAAVAGGAGVPHGRPADEPVTPSIEPSHVALSSRIAAEPAVPPARVAVAAATPIEAAPRSRQPDPRLCRIDDPDCESCQ
ncbi:MAG: ribonucleoside-diphosphate reductase subunit alpha [Acidobacteriota bacterium]|nr:ribonucleoside-diphosphate reductase subunit alpha [Acidobacteriota bacterium]